MTNRLMRFVLLASLVGNLAVVWVGYKAYMYRSHINYWLEKYTAVVEEFSGRDYYASANEAIRSETTVPGRVVFFGTQVIRRWDLSRLVPGWETVNRGIDGQRLSGMVLRFQPDVIELGPEAVVIEISSYNFRPETPVREIEDYTESMADLARVRGIAPIVGSVIPPWRGAVDLGDYAIMDSIAAFNVWLREGAGEGRWYVVDFNGELADEEGFLQRGLSVESIDPNETGYRRLSRLVDSVLVTVVGRRSGGQEEGKIGGGS